MSGIFFLFFSEKSTFGFFEKTRKKWPWEYCNFDNFRDFEQQVTMRVMVIFIFFEMLGDFCQFKILGVLRVNERGGGRIEVGD